jgi:hypothetical protein
MWKRAPHLVIGIVSLLISAYFLLGLVSAWKNFWRHELSRPAHPAKASGSASDDPLLGAAKVKVYGVLSSKEEAESEDDAAPPEKTAPASPVEQVARTTLAPNHFLQKRILIQTYKGVEFVVPPLALHPQLQGTFRSVAAGQATDASPVEVLLMTDGDFATFARNQTETTEASAPPAVHGRVDWILTATYGKPQKYYLVFLNSSEGQEPVMVDADFTVSFGQ